MNWAVEVKKVFNKKTTTEYIIGSKDKISKLYDEMTDNQLGFQKRVQSEYRLKTLPSMTIKAGTFGKVDNKKALITVKVEYDCREAKAKRIGFFKTFFITMFVVAILIVGLYASILSASLNFAKAAENLDLISQECLVVTQEGKPLYITMYGETLFYDNKGVVIPEIREILPQEQMAYDRPFTYCKILAIDGKEPVSY